ncbi:MAG: translation initiation factor IF-2 [Candidatus Aenigmarchaeota archaeon]|nr:translation initiation factor IF-2 [Candidatus Aenigmarchaeota archaeon]
MQNIRQPIIAVLGHVDHGKTTFLDRIRQTTVAAKEPGQITQAIGASVVPKNVIEKLCGNLLEKFRFSVEVPGLLFIDTPGHEAFTSLRRRGGALADLAVLIVDIMEGVMPQTEESLRILKEEKTPFVVAVNKIDRIRGWRSLGEEQPDFAKQEFEERFYKVLEQISRFGFACDKYDRIPDFKKAVAAVPMSGKTGEGVPEIMAMLVGLSQTFLKITEEGRGFILEVRETTGLGKTADVILYDGKIEKGSWIAVGGPDPFLTKIKALLVIKPLKEMRAENHFLQVDECAAACGVKIAAPEIERAVAGAGIIVGKDKKSAEESLEELEKERMQTEVHRETEGLVVKTDTIGSLEALLNVLKDYPIKEATIGAVTRGNILLAQANEEEKNRVVIAFNADTSEEMQALAKKSGVAIIKTDVIYHIIDEYEDFVKRLAEELMDKQVADATRPAEIHILKGYVFRQSHPAIVGCEIKGILKPGCSLLKEGRGIVGTVKQMQKEGKNVEDAKSGDKVAVSIEGPTVGRQIEEGDVLYTDISSEDYKKLREYEELLTKDEADILEIVAEMKRKSDKMYGL